MKRLSPSRTLLAIRCALFGSALLCAGAALAQQNVPFANGVPVAPTGLADQPLGDGPWHYNTGEGMDITVELAARLEYGMAMAFLPDDSLLVVTRKGILYQLKDGELREIPG